MELLTLTAPPATVLRYADFSDRVVAKLIDFALLGICLLPLDIVFGSSFLDELHRTRVEGLLAFTLFCLYSAALESSNQQATWGKRAVGIVVSGVDGNRISFAYALLRAVMQYAGTGYLLVMFTRRRQALHDLVAKTVVTPGTL